jgi:cell pole-organizing protein PopZ
MEEILASIRRIISEDTEPAEPSKPEPAPAPSAPAPVSAFAPPPPSAPEPMDEDVLELTQMVQDDGSVVDVDDPQDDPWSRAMDPEPEPEPDEPEPPLSLETLDDLFDRPATRPQPVSRYDDDDLVSAPTAAATSAAFAQLATSIGGNRFSGSMHAYGGGPTVEDILKDLLRPLLRDWLDQNLPPMVERMVQREIEKMVRRAQGG